MHPRRFGSFEVDDRCGFIYDSRTSMNMRLWTNAFGTLFTLCSTALYGQWGFKVNFLDTDFGQGTRKTYLNHNVGLGFDLDLTSKISTGADVSHSWDIAWKGW